MSRSKRDWYAELSSRLDSAEISPDILTLSHIADRVEWCWKWRLITEDQMKDLCSRVTDLFNLC